MEGKASERWRRAGIFQWVTGERARQPRWKITVQRWLKRDTLYSLDLGSLAIRGSVAAKRERKWCMLYFFHSPFLPFSKSLSDILFLLLHPSPWLIGSLTSLQQHESPHRDIILSRALRFFFFFKNKELLCCIELHNGGKSLSLSTMLLKSISAPKGIISYIFNHCFCHLYTCYHCIFLQKQS